jgi:hypothetical protein
MWRMRCGGGDATGMEDGSAMAYSFHWSGWVGATHTLALHSGGYPPTASLTDSDQMKHHAAGDRPFLHGFGSRSRLRMF